MLRVLLICESSPKSAFDQRSPSKECFCISASSPDNAFHQRNRSANAGVRAYGVCSRAAGDIQQCADDESAVAAGRLVCAMSAEARPTVALMTGRA